jgi:hypothetical protein
MTTRMPNEESKKDVNREEKEEEQGQQKQDNNGRDRKKRTVQFDKGQKFTSDEDILRRRTA